MKGNRMYPTLKEVENADRRQICSWYRFLPSPDKPEKVEVMNRIVERFKQFGGFTPEISKELG